MALVDDFESSKVTIKRGELLAAIRSNREVHAKDYTEALAGFKVAFIEECENLLALAKAGNTEKQVIGLSTPQDHTKDYDRVIRMLEMSTAEEITVSEDQFSKYVLDEWAWQRDFAATKMRYLNNGR